MKKMISSFYQKAGWMLLFCFGLAINNSTLMAEERKVVIQAPATPTSIPLILAVEQLPELEIKIFTNHSQAHSLFLNGDAQILCTGLSVGVRFSHQKIPVQIINSYVSGLTYLVADKEIASFTELKGEKLWLPFAGSPIEEITRFFVSKEKLHWREDIEIGYTRFPSMVALFQQKKIRAAVLPEPFVSLLGNNKQLHVVSSYKDLWQQHTGQREGYPQVVTLVKKEWATANRQLITKLNTALETSIIAAKQDPVETIARVKSYFKFPEKILINSLEKTDFRMLKGNALKQEVFLYYQTLGRPLDEDSKALF